MPLFVAVQCCSTVGFEMCRFPPPRPQQSDPNHGRDRGRGGGGGAGGGAGGAGGRGEGEGEDDALLPRPIIKEEDLNRMDDIGREAGWAISDDIDYK